MAARRQGAVFGPYIENIHACNPWLLPIAGYLAYFAFFILGYIIDLPALNLVGAFSFFSVILVGFVGRTRLPILFSEGSIKIAAALSVYPFVQLMLVPVNIQFVYFVKNILFFLTYIVIYAYAPPALYECRYRYLIIIVTLVVIMMSLFSGRTFSLEGEIRPAGLFSDPNNLALMLLSLLFFVSNSLRRKKERYILIIAVAVGVIFTATSGALTALLVGLGYRYWEHAKKPRIRIYATIIVFVLVFLLTYPVFANFQFVTRIVTQLNIIYQNIPILIGGGELNFGELSADSGTSVLSGIWRIHHWLTAISMTISGSILIIIFGHGIGSSTALLGNVPHNEYVRVFFEQGVFGCILNCLFFTKALKRYDGDYAYIIWVFAIFALTQNIIENMLFVYLFMMHLASVRHRQVARSVQFEPR